MRILFMRQQCGRCSSATPIWSDVCVECGLVLHSPRRLRAMGVVYLALGSLLAAAAGYLVVLIATIIARSDDPQATTRFNGSGWDAAFAFGVLGFVLVLGLTGMLMGVWQILRGRRNLNLVRVVIVLYLIFWVGAMLVRFSG